MKRERWQPAHKIPTYCREHKLNASKKLIGYANSMAIPRTYFFTNGDANMTQLFILVTYGYTQKLFPCFCFWK